MNNMSASAHPLFSGFDEAAFLRLLEARPDEERWELIDGEPIMMTPPAGTHQKIVSNLARCLDDALETTRPELVTVHEIGVRIPGFPKFLPVPDLVVAAAEEIAVSYLDRFFLAAEVLSPSNSQEFIALKLERYAAHPDNLYTLMIASDEMRVEVWAREREWSGEVLRGPTATLRLPAFGLSCPVADLYRRTPVTAR